MKYLLDTAELKAIEEGFKQLPVSGVTTNPSILKKAGPKDFFAHLRSIRGIIGPSCALHVQVTAPEAGAMLREAELIGERLGEDVFIKVPVTLTGLQVIRQLKRRGQPVTATCVYSRQQAYLAMEAGADAVAPYFNRMENQGIDAGAVIRDIAAVIQKGGYACEILGASFKNAGQLDRAIAAGAHSVTVDPQVLYSALSQESILGAERDFTRDWESLFGQLRIYELL